MDPFSIPRTSHWISKKKKLIETFSGVAELSSSSLFSSKLLPPIADIDSDTSIERESGFGGVTMIPCSGESGKWKKIHMYQERNKRREKRLERERGKGVGKKKKSKGKKKASSSSSSSESYSRGSKKKSTPKKKKKAGKKKKKSKKK